VRHSGGTVKIADPESTLISRAQWLRKTAWEEADCVVLHIGNSEVIAPVAFGIAGGPPVLLMNHAAHVFWTGASVADIVLNCRGSNLEIEWTHSYRGARQCATLPIPLEIPVQTAPGSVFSPEERLKAKMNLELPLDAVTLLTVGASFKYKPLSGASFFDAAQSLLTRYPQLYLLVAGLTEDRFWKMLQSSFQGRVRVMGRQFNLRQYYAATDVYIEGFPFGSTTAFLEAGIHGIPAVLAPGICPPPFGTDGVALDSLLIRPATVEDYIGQIASLINDDDERRRYGNLLAESIIQHHSGAGWKSYFNKLIEMLPSAHSVSMPKPKSPPKLPLYFWTDFVSTWPYFIGRYHGDPLEYPFRIGIERGMNPKIDKRLYRNCQAFQRTRREGSLPLLLYILLQCMLPIFPSIIGLFIFDSLIKVCSMSCKLRRQIGFS
jgi:hypothetical protein